WSAWPVRCESSRGEPGRPVVTLLSSLLDAFSGWRFAPAMGLNLGYAVVGLRGAGRDECEEPLAMASVAHALTGGLRAVGGAGESVASHAGEIAQLAGQSVQAALRGPVACQYFII